VSGQTSGLAPCGVRHVAMTAPFTPIAAEAGERAVYAVFWREGRPAGGLVLLSGELPVPAAAVPTLAAAAIGRSVAMMTPEPAAKAEGEAGDHAAGLPVPPTVSVVVCTRDRAQDLGRCLASLSRCTPAPAEIVVVDNAPSDDATKAVVRLHPNVRYLREPRAGLSHARNTGVRAASGTIVAFTDDDVEVSADWIARLAAPFADPEVACVTGIVLPADLSGEAACLFEFTVGAFGKEFAPKRYDRTFLDREWWRAPDVWRVGAGASMAIRREAFAEVGLFDPRLGAGASGCSEDSEFWFRLLQAGRVCIYDPAAVVFHHHRSDLAGLSRQLRAYTRGHVVALFVQFAQDRRPCHLVRVFAIMPWHFLTTFIRALRQQDRARLAVVVPQFRGWLESPIHAVRWLRRDGPPRLAGDTP
jgi:GT2 family glycosyltransferase